MELSTAQRITGATVHIGLALTGITAGIAREHIETIRRVSLPQMQTAKDVIEAENARPGQTKICCVCEDDLLANVKRYADAVAI